MRDRAGAAGAASPAAPEPAAPAQVAPSGVEPATPAATPAAEPAPTPAATPAEPAAEPSAEPAAEVDLHLGEGEFQFSDEAGAGAGAPAPASAGDGTPAAPAEPAPAAEPLAPVDVSSLPPEEVAALQELHQALESGDDVEHIERALSRTGRGRRQLVAFKTLRAVEDGDPENGIQGLGIQPSAENIREWYGDANYLRGFEDEITSGDPARIENAVGQFFGSERDGDKVAGFAPPRAGMEQFFGNFLNALSQHSPKLYDAAIQPQRVAFLDGMARNIAGLPAGEDNSPERSYRNSVIKFFRDVEHRVTGEARPAGWFSEANRRLSPAQAQAEENRRLRAELDQRAQREREQAWDGFRTDVNQQLNASVTQLVSEALADVRALYPADGADDPSQLRELFADQREVYINRVISGAQQHPQYSKFSAAVNSARRLLESPQATAQQRDQARKSILLSYDQIVRSVARGLRGRFVIQLASAARAKAAATSAQLANAAQPTGVAPGGTGQHAQQSVLPTQPQASGNGQPPAGRQDGESSGAFMSRSIRDKMANADRQAQRAGRA
jgi:hypothetical protein